MISKAFWSVWGTVKSLVYWGIMWSMKSNVIRPRSEVEEVEFIKRMFLECWRPDMWHNEIDIQRHTQCKLSCCFSFYDVDSALMCFLGGHRWWCSCGGPPPHLFEEQMCRAAHKVRPGTPTSAIYPWRAEGQVALWSCFERTQRRQWKRPWTVPE